ncbi:MAG: hypothetical protein WEA61_10820 [Anaerolineales bacterium]
MKSTFQNGTDTNRILRIVLWAVGGLLLLAALCCFCTLAVGWYAGDFVVNLLRSLFAN